VLDVVHLGLGDDGHTASLVPGDPVLGVTDRLVAPTGPYLGHRRVTLTYPAINAARHIVWLVAGAGKGEMLRRLVAGDPTIPAGRVLQDRAVVVCDEAAAAPLLNER
jgi:6-phosphogluconolactonase/glucosamine-6-phosphate isomerase/deaminase